MKKITIFSLGVLFLFCQTTTLQAQSGSIINLYESFAPYPKTPFTGEFSIKRITNNVDTIDYPGYVGGRVYWAITRSDDGRSDIFRGNGETAIRTYDEKNRLLSVVWQINENRWDTLMHYSYDEEGRILKRKESWRSPGSYQGGYYDSFFVRKSNGEIFDGGLRSTTYDYENNTITQDLTYYDYKENGTKDTIEDKRIVSQVQYIYNGYIVTTEGHEEKFSIATTHNRITQAGDVSYTYSSDGFTEYKGDLWYKYTFNKDGLLEKVTSNDVYVYRTFRYTESTVSNEHIDALQPQIILVNGLLSVMHDAFFDVAVYNMQGMCIAQRYNNCDEVSIPLDNAAPGIYIVRVTSGRHTHTEKLYKR